MPETLVGFDQKTVGRKKECPVCNLLSLQKKHKEGWYLDGDKLTCCLLFKCSNENCNTFVLTEFAPKSFYKGEEGFNKFLTRLKNDPASAVFSSSDFFGIAQTDVVREV